MEPDWYTVTLQEPPTVTEDAVFETLDGRDEDTRDWLGLVERGSDDAPPIQLRLAKPRAISLRRYLEQAGVALGPDVVAAARASVPLLLVHHVTAFAPDGQAPPRIFGVGYECVPQDTDADTVSLAPASQHEEVARAGGSLLLRAGGRGTLDLEQAGVPRQVLERFGDVSIEAAADATLHVALRCGWTRMTVQAGPVGAGGAKWNLYGHRADLRASQALVHTLLVPEGQRSLRVGIKAWARQQAAWLGLRAARSWVTAEQTWDLALDGL